MDLNITLAPQERAQLDQAVAAFNRTLDGGTGRTAQADLGKDDFLKILITQLSHQDPTQPMEDREFIAQMAQFSSLEQITNMNQGLSRLATLLAASQAVNLLGQMVVVGDGENAVSGLVDEVSGGDYPQVLVNGQFYDVSQVTKIRKQAKE
jgi:flagellar basal-body rod modification protein FlgD